MTNKHNNNNSSTNGHVNPFYLEIEEEHDDEELSDYEDGVEQAGLLRPTAPIARSRNNPGPRKQWRRRLCLLLVVILALFAFKWNRKITPGGSEGEKLPANDDDDKNDNDDDDNSDDDKVPVIPDDNKKPVPNNNNQGKKPTNDTPNASIDPNSCFQTGDSPILINTDDDSLKYACPCTFDADQQPPTHSMFPDHSSQIISNLTKFMKTFRHMELDDWGHSYAEVKKGMHDWIAQRYAPYLADNSLIYESALGDGLHLHMVLDIMKEVKQIHNITVYGNDRSSGSVQVATALGKQKYLPTGGKLGTICQADSTQLAFVPSESFDLVFTAYIPPLSDPLEWHPSGDPLNAYLTLCKKAENGDEEAMKQKRDAQHRQDRWFAQWFAEMVRVAKKGAPIIVEHVSYPFCEATFDWGGVSKDFWTQAARNKGYNLDAKSLIFEDDKLFRKRYHMFVRKNR